MVACAWVAPGAGLGGRREKRKAGGGRGSCAPRVDVEDRMTAENPPLGVSQPRVISEASRRYALFILFIAYVFNFLDRQIVSILQEPIKQDLHLSDTQLGLLTGFAFALFYATLGLPIARLADKKARTGIIALSITIWSAMTALCATAGNFASLLLFRIGVGVGEAGLSPSAHSLISDYFPRERRATALAIYSMGIQVGVMAGYLAGGWINQYFGWRRAFLVVGVPGLLLAALIALTLREPPRGHSDEQPSDAAAPQSYLDMLRALWRLKTFRYVSLGCGLHAFCLYGHGNWGPPFLSRVHGLDSAEIGSWLALIAIGPGTLGILCAGLVADYLGRKDIRAYLWVPALSTVLIIPFELGAFLIGNTALALVFIGLKIFVGGLYLAPCIGVGQTLVPPNMRASTSAVLLLVLSIIGLGLGPLAVGFLSDQFDGLGFGPEALRYALVAIIPMEVIAGFLFLAAARHFPKELKR